MADSKKSKKSGKTITKSDATRLERLVRGEIAFIDTAISQRVNEMKAEAREQIEAESEKLAKNARTRIERLRKKAEKLENEGRELLEELRDEGFDIQGHNAHVVTFTVNDKVEVKSQQRRLNAAFADIERQANEARNGIRGHERLAVRDLTLQSVDSDEARTLVESIPSADNLLSMPDLKKITA